MNACTANQVQENCLHAVVAMMGYTNAIKRKIFTQVLKISIAERAGCHLYAHMMKSGVTSRVEMGKVQRHPTALTQVLTKLFVPVRLLSTKMKITMSRFYMKPHVLHG